MPFFFDKIESVKTWFNVLREIWSSSIQMRPLLRWCSPFFKWWSLPANHCQRRATGASGGWYPCCTKASVNTKATIGSDTLDPFAVSTNVPLHQAGDGQKDNLAACYLFILLLFGEQLKHSVSFGCPLLQDYSLLNLLAVFSIILSQVSLPSCPLTQRQIEGRRQGEREDGYRQIEALRVPSAWKWPPED